MQESDAQPRKPSVPDAGAPAAALTAEERKFLDGLVVFLRAIPMYPSGHVRVDDAVGRLQEAMSVAAKAWRLEVHDGELLLQDKPVDSRGGGRGALRDALQATGVARVTIAYDAPKASLVHFARMLHRNQKLIKEGGVTFDQIWVDAVPGVLVEERIYGAGAFAEECDLEEADEGEDVDANDAVGAPEATGDGATGEAKTARRLARRLKTVSRSLRRLARDNERTRALLGTLEGRFEPPKDVHRNNERLDLLEYVLRLLPAEARRDPEVGMRTIERILQRFAESLVERRTLGPSQNLAASLVRGIAGLFPSSSKLGAGPAPAEDAAQPKSAEDARREKERDLGEDLDLLRRAAAEHADEPPAVIAAEVTSTETGPILIHALVDAVDTTRRDLLRTRLVQRLREKRDPVDRDCLAQHFHEAVVAFGKKPADTTLLRTLATVVADAGLFDLAQRSGALAPEIVAATFPVLAGAYRAVAGGRLGQVCRLVGRKTVVEAAAALLAPGGLIHGDGGTRLLAERGTDALPMIEVLIRSGDAVLRDRAVRALRAMRLPSAAASVLGAVPGSRLPDDFLAGLCEDGFDGKDSHRHDALAISLLTEVMLSKEQEMPARLYSLNALASFPRTLVEPALRTVWAKRHPLLPLAPAFPKEMRRAAKAVLDRWDVTDLAREAAQADLDWIRRSA